MNVWRDELTCTCIVFKEHCSCVLVSTVSAVARQPANQSLQIISRISADRVASLDASAFQLMDKHSPELYLTADSAVPNKRFSRRLDVVVG